MAIIRPSLTLEAKLGVNKLRKTDSENFEELLKGHQPTKSDFKDLSVKKPSHQPVEAKGRPESNVGQKVSQRLPQTAQSPCPICGAMRHNMKSHLSKVHKAQTDKPSKQSQSSLAKPTKKKK